MDFEKELAEEVSYCTQTVERYLPGAYKDAESPRRKTIEEAMEYSVMGGGKRLRPMFIHQGAKMYGAAPSLYEPFMAALEMIHSYSLVHDDLPAMDNDRYRRGRLTTWAVYGDGMAVLAGDALLNFAYETAMKALDAPEAVDPQVSRRICRALRVLAGNAGIYGMVGGQCADVEAEKKNLDIDEDMLLYIHRNKTAALIDSGLRIGGILGDAPEEDDARMHRIAQAIGVAFQIQDDILDVTGTSKELGKTAGKDAAEGKKTYVSLHGLQTSKEKVRELTDGALHDFDSLSQKNDFLRHLLMALVTRTR